MAETWMRVVIYRAAGDTAEAVVYLKSSTRETVALLEKQRGFKLGYWGHNSITQEMAAVTYWDSLDAIHAADPFLDKLHEKRAKHGILVISARNIRLFALPVGPAWQDLPSQI